MHLLIGFYLIKINRAFFTSLHTLYMFVISAQQTQNKVSLGPNFDLTFGRLNI
jgi:hypothetical protein